MNLLSALINRADTTRDTDGQFISSCSDAVNRPTPDRVRELVVAWGSSTRSSAPSRRSTW